MTWQKTRPELYDQAAADELSESAVLMHIQALGWIYRTERDDCMVPRRLLVGATPLTEDRPSAVAELVAAGYWVEGLKAFELRDHADVVRSSLVAQRKKRRRDAAAQERVRDRRTATESVTDSSAESATTQPTNQPSNHGLDARAPTNLGQCVDCDHREPLDQHRRCPDCAEQRLAG